MSEGKISIDSLSYGDIFLELILFLLVVKQGLKEIMNMEMAEKVMVVVTCFIVKTMVEFGLSLKT